MSQNETLVEVSNLQKHFQIRQGMLGGRAGTVKAVNDVSFDIRKGEVVGLVGESGSGKSTLGRLVMGLLEPSGGSVRYSGRTLHHGPDRMPMAELRRQAQIIFQDPYSSLNRYFTVERILTEPLALHRIGANARERRERVVDLLDMVGFGPEVLRKYPHQFSGGQRQRIGIARALTLDPQFIVADEPVSALDVSIQAQVLNILSGLQRQRSLALLFITHDLSVLRQISDRSVVLYLGQVMEIAPTEKLFHNSAHPYTKALIASAPSIHAAGRVARKPLTGEIPSPVNPPSGCPFRTRCPMAEAICAEARPPLVPVARDHLSACHFAAPGRIAA